MKKLLLLILSLNFIYIYSAYSYQQEKIINQTRLFDGSKISIVASPGHEIMHLKKNNPNGSLDLNFGFYGTAAIWVPGSTSTEAQNISIESNNKILVSGVTIIGGVKKPFEVRFNRDGRLDLTYGGGTGIILLF